VNLVTHQASQALVNELVSRNRPLTMEFIRNHDDLEMRIVIGQDPHNRVVKGRLYQALDFSRVHCASNQCCLGARSVPGKHTASQCQHSIVYDTCPSPARLKLDMLGNLLEVIAGLALLIWGADRFVHGAAATARNLGVTPLLIGLTIVAVATSAPEILVSVDAAVRNKAGLAIGNAIGSNIANIGLVLGCVALIRPIELRSATLRREMSALLAVSLLTVSLFLDTRLSRVDGIVLLTGLVIVMIWLARLGVRSAPSDPIKQDYEAEIPADVSMPMAVLWLLLGLAMMLIGAHLLVDSAIAIAMFFGVSDVVIGILLVAVGTSLPELAVSLVSAMKGEFGLAIGNIVGSNIFNLLAVIGVAVTISPTALPPSVLSLHIFVMVAFTLVLFAMTYDYDGKSELSRIEGAALLVAFLAYDTYVVLQNVRIG